MTDFDHIPIETTEGRRQPSPAGDRMLVGLAAVALAGGLLIAIGNIFGGDEAVSVASESPAATAEPARTERPSPSPRPRIEFTVEPAIPPSTDLVPQPFNGWIRTSADLVLYASPDLAAPEAGVLAAGSAAYAEEWPDDPAAEAGWLHVSSPTPDGWISPADALSERVERFTQSATTTGAAVWDLVAGADGFVAIGSAPGRSNEIPEMFLVSSADGARWRASSPDAPVGWHAWIVAWGPAGWLLVHPIETPEGTVSIWVWHSPDGTRWSPLGKMTGLPRDSYPRTLVASEGGYLLIADNWGRGGSTPSVWFSSDGVAWQEGADLPIGSDAYIQVAASPNGFYAWNAASAGTGASAAFSIDGRTWTAVATGPGGPALVIASTADRIIGIDDDPDTGATRIWTGTVVRDRIAWLREADSEAAFSGAQVSELVSDGRRAVAFGWNVSTDQPLTWIQDGDRWRRSALPAEFLGTIPRMAAAGPTGFALVGYRPTVRGTNPVFWHSADGESWGPERSPAIDVVPDPTDEECPSTPADAVEFAVLDRSMAVACFGDAPITFRAWAAECEGCYWGATGRKPGWLMGVTDEQLFLTPISTSDYLGGPPAVIHPSLEYDPEWTRQWLDVTGHFDDPAAADCRYTPPPSEIVYYEGPWAIVSQCRQQFVVTAVSVVEFPTVPSS